MSWTTLVAANVAVEPSRVGWAIRGENISAEGHAPSLTEAAVALVGALASHRHAAIDAFTTNDTVERGIELGREAGLLPHVSVLPQHLTPTGAAALAAQAAAAAKASAFLQKTQTVSVDGSYAQMSGGGYGFITEDGERFGLGRVKASGSTAAEIAGICAAIRALAPKVDVLKIRTDSLGAIGAFKLAQGEETNGTEARFASWAETRHTATIIAAALREKGSCELVFEHVAGHTGDRGNEAADSLAVYARRQLNEKQTIDSHDRSSAFASAVVHQIVDAYNGVESPILLAVAA